VDRHEKSILKSLGFASAVTKIRMIVKPSDLAARSKFPDMTAAMCSTAKGIWSQCICRRSSVSTSREAPVKIAFAALHQGYYRNLESVIEQLADRGHQIYLGHERPDSAIGGHAIVERLASRFPNIMHGRIPAREPELAVLASRVRLGFDYLRYLHPMYTRVSGLRPRAEIRTPVAIVRLSRSRLMSYRLAQQLVGRCLDTIDRAVPLSPAIEAFLDQQRPDLLVVTPLIGLGASSQIDVLRSAQARGVPTAVLVWSWDHLSSKAIIRDVVDGLFVWNEAQKQEAMDMHGVPEGRIVVTGAQCFDKWFGRGPTRSRAEFLRRVGLPEDRPYVAWVCSALLPGSPPEPQLVTRWVEHLRASADPRLRAASILIRPHPSRTGDWEGVDWMRFGNIALFGDNPIEEDARDDYFDTLYHSAAVVGITTSAFIEAAIVNRPVMTIYFDEVRQEHEGSLHFQLLLNFAGGLMTAAATLEEHAAQLTTLIEGAPSELLERQRRFVKAFVRPHGLMRPATDIVGRSSKRSQWGRRPLPVRGPSALGRWGVARWRRAERHPRWRYWLMDRREAANAARMDEKLRLRDEALARNAKQREEKARRAASRAR
jgi:hypothetical protein